MVVERSSTDGRTASAVVVAGLSADGAGRRRVVTALTDVSPAMVTVVDVESVGGGK